MMYETPKNRKYWVHPMNEIRDEAGEHPLFVQQLRLYPERFKQYFRMDVETFDWIHSLIQKDVYTMDTNMRQAIPAEMKLSCVLR